MTLNVLLVEDDEVQAYLVGKALQSWTTPYNLDVATTAEEALELIKRGDRVSNRPPVHLALVDIYLPGQSGFRVVEAIAKDPDLRRMAVVMVLSASRSQDDIRTALSLHANAYIIKPGDYDQLRDLFQTIEAFWRNDVRLSPAGDPQGCT